jgi:hypothetical protein
MNNRARLVAAQSYALYYGSGKAEELSRFDVAIVEPAGQQETDVALMKANGTLVLAYVSVTEVAGYDPLFPLLEPSDWLLDVAGKPLRNDVFNTSLVDLRSSRWQSLLLHRIGSFLTRSGYDGVFLDTIGNTESFGHQVEAAAALVERMRRMHPDAVLVQNNGLNSLCMETKCWIDGVCWENPSFADSEAAAWNKAVVTRLQVLMESNDIAILLLLETGKAEHNSNMRLAERIAADNGFLLYGAPSEYVGGVEWKFAKRRSFHP